ncbi:hypothetical protein IT570_01400 [Candidatus Sumerlaeota bacterium]|nr:hypothetical protein [Candidatus Sumerlaeota bacterium]
MSRRKKRQPAPEAPPSTGEAPASASKPAGITPATFASPTLTVREAWVSFLVALGIVFIGYWQITLAGKSLASDVGISNIFESGCWREGGTFEQLNRTPAGIFMTGLDRVGSAIMDEPAPYVAHSLYFSGNMPWLNPYQGMSHPFAADMMSAVFYPLQVLPILFPSTIIWELYLILRIILFGWFTYLYLRSIGISRLASTCAGLQISFGGYVLQWANLFHLNVDLMLPALLFCIEMWFAKRHRGWLIAIAFSMYCAITGGNPQPLILMCAFIAAYVPVRAIAVASRRGFPARLGEAFLMSVAVCAACAVGAGLAGILIFPFVELFQDSFKTRSTGFGDYTSTPGNRIFYLYPQIVHGYVGIDISVRENVGKSAYPLLGGGIASTMFVLASPARIRRMPSIVILFVGTFVLCLLKALAFPPLQFFHRIPIVQNIYIAKYVVVLVFSGAVLVGIGADYIQARLYEKSFGWRRPILIVMCVAAIWVPYIWLKQWIVQNKVSFAAAYEYSVIVDSLLMKCRVIMVYATAAITLAILLSRWVSARMCAYVMLSALAFESALSAYRPYGDRTELYDPPPFAKFLKERQKQKQGRLYAVGPILFPTSASVFGLEDIRHFDALEWQPYYDFMKILITGQDTRFYAQHTGSNDPKIVKSPMLSVSNTRYIVTDTSPYSTEVTSLFYKNGLLLSKKDLPEGDPLRRGELVSTTIDSQRRRTAVIVGAPDTWLISLMVSSPQEELRFFYGMYSGFSDANHGDGTRVQVYAEPQDSPVRVKLFDQPFDPKTDRLQRKWFPVRIPLGQFRGKSVRLYFHIDPGPAGNADYDSIFLADMSLKSVDQSDNKLRLIYDKEIFIYENLEALNRAFLSPSIRLVDSIEQIKPMVENEKLRIVASVPVLNTPEAAAAKELLGIGNPPPGAHAGTVATMRDDLYHKNYDVDAERPALLTISNLAYPGWRAYINGKEKPILKAFGALQGVVVPQGKNTVEIIYQSRSVMLGWLATSASAIILLLTGAGPIAWRKLRSPNKENTGVESPDSPPVETHAA